MTYPYTPDPEDTAKPADTDSALMAAPEIRELKTYLADELASIASSISALQASSSGVNNNLLINGNFVVAQRGESQTAAGYGSVDRWLMNRNGTTGTMSRQAFTLGQTDVPGEPEFFLRHVVSSVSNAANYYNFEQRIEDVRTGANQDVTVSFYAKASASLSVAVELTQNFGSGGSTSVAVTPQKQLITTGWVKYSLTFAVPAIVGKTIGSDDYLSVNIWLDAGTDFNSNTGTLGHQSGTFEFAQIKSELSSSDTAFASEPLCITISKCLRFFECEKMEDLPATGTNWQSAYNSSSNIGLLVFPFKVTKRKIPTFSLGSGASWSNTPTVRPYTSAVYCKGNTAYYYINVSGLSQNDIVWQADAEL